MYNIISHIVYIGVGFFFDKDDSNHKIQVKLAKMQSKLSSSAVAPYPAFRIDEEDAANNNRFDYKLPHKL